MSFKTFCCTMCTHGMVTYNLQVLSVSRIDFWEVRRDEHTLP
jgi:hypothetical protein